MTKQDLIKRCALAKLVLAVFERIKYCEEVQIPLTEFYTEFNVPGLTNDERSEVEAIIESITTDVNYLKFFCDFHGIESPLLV